MLQSNYLLANWYWLAIGLGGFYASLLISKLLKHRKLYASLPGPPHSMLWGHLKDMGEAMQKYPSDMHPQAAWRDMGNEVDHSGIFYLDIYPISEPIILITDIELALKVQNNPEIIRHPFVNGYLRGMIGPESIFVLNGPRWKQQHGWFAPAFSMQHLLTLVPGMIEETLVFKAKLTEFAASGEIFSMGDSATKLAIDIIARSVGDFRLKSQTQYSGVQHHFMAACDWTSGVSSPLYKKMIGSYMMDWHTRKLDKVLGKIIKDNYASPTRESGYNKSILDLAWKGYSKEKGETTTRPDQDPDFMKIALDNAKVFLVGGHDTTSSMVTYTFYYLSANPSILARVRAEHNRVLGTTLEETIQNLTTNPALLNNLPLTLAVQKEVLRLNPIGTTVRQAAPGTTISWKGREYPLENHMISILTATLHRDPAIWGNNVNGFDPDRFLEEGRHDNNAWQPFEKGPRNCIGQQLALLEGRTIAALTVRFFDFEACFKKGTPNAEGWGGQAYQELKMSSKPKNGIPMRAKVVE